MFTTIIQKWNTFKADWQEYQKLRRVAGRAWHKLDSLRTRITNVHSPDKNVPSKSCIRTNFVWLPHPMHSDGAASENCTLMMAEDYCPHFKDFNFEDDVPSCQEKSCACYAKHCEYAAAAEEYTDAVKRRREFWSRSQRGKEK